MANRPHPHVSIPPGAAPPTNPSPSSTWSSYLYRSSPEDPPNIWSDHGSVRNSTSGSTSTPRISLDLPSRPPSRAASFYDQDTSRITMPEHQLYRSASQRASLRPNPTPAHRATRSELTVSPTHFSGESRPPSVISTSSSPDVGTFHPSSTPLDSVYPSVALA